MAGLGWARCSTSVVAVVGLATATVGVLGLGSPVGHAAQLVALGEGGVGDTIQHVVGGGSGAPGVLGRQGGDDVCDGEGSHDV